MIIKGVLPIGSVVLLKESGKRLMIVGLAQFSASKKFYDYCGVLFPEGYQDADSMYLFNDEDIDMLFSMGYQNSEGLEFKEKIEKAIHEQKNEFF